MGALRELSSGYSRESDSDHDKKGNKKGSKFHLTVIPGRFRIFLAKCTAHMGARRIKPIHVNLHFGPVRVKSVLLY